jgi:hypothetical protein
MTENDHGLTRLQLDILELESMTWSQNGSKIAEFRRRHPLVTETGYYLALLGLLSNQTAYEYDGQRYAPMLQRISARQRAEFARRVGLRGVRTQ